MKTLLLVTWIGFGGPTTQSQFNSYQVIFSSEKTCEAARSALLAGLQDIRELNNIGRGNPVSVSAICTAQ